MVMFVITRLLLLLLMTTTMMMMMMIIWRQFTLTNLSAYLTDDLFSRTG